VATGGRGGTGGQGSTTGAGGTGGNGGAASASGTNASAQGGDGEAGGNGNTGGAGGVGGTGSASGSGAIASSGTGGVAGAGSAGFVVTVLTGSTGAPGGSGQGGANGAAGDPGAPGDGGAGIDVTGGTASIVNAGTIAGGSGANPGAGILVRDSATAASLGNAGTVSGARYAIRAGTGGGANLSAIEITGAGAQIVGDVWASNAQTRVKTGAAFANTNAFDVNTFTVEAGATFTMSAGAKTALAQDGVRTIAGFSNLGVIRVDAGVTAPVTGDYTQAGSGRFRVGATSSTQHGRMTVSGSANLPAGATIDVVTGDDCAAIADGQVLSAVISAGALVATTFTVNDDCTGIRFTAAVNGNALDLVASVDRIAAGSAVAVPTLRGPGMAALGGLMLAAGLLVARRRQRSR
jgi:hypothetical protein